jgi:hypothetical protein
VGGSLNRRELDHQDGAAEALGSFWMQAKALLATPVEESELPASLLARWGGAGRAALEAVLRFIAPVTSESVRARISMVV